MKVLRANMFRNSVALLTDANEELELTLEEWDALDPRRPDAPPRPEGKPVGEKPAAPRPHDELMVVMADPDSIDDAFSDEADGFSDESDEAEESDGTGEGTGDGTGDGAAGTSEEGRPKRKRKRKK